MFWSTVVTAVALLDVGLASWHSNPVLPVARPFAQVDPDPGLLFGARV